MSNYVSTGNAKDVISEAALHAHLDRYIVEQIEAKGVKRLLILPPDHTRLNSMAGPITAYLWDKLSETVHIDLMPALGTHVPMTEAQCRMMFGDRIPIDRILPHRWRDDLIELGELPAEFLGELSEGKLVEPMQVAVNKRLFEGDYDLILSIGQVVPHEVIGLANYTKNVMIGVGGKDTIDKSHFLGAVCGMESIMGRADTPVRRALNAGFDRFVRPALNVQFILTVIGPDENFNNVLRGLYIGDDDATFEAAGELSREVNFDVFDEPLDRCVVYLDPEEFHTTWLGNKAVYRTRMAMADGGELIILAPKLSGFGEDPGIDTLIRRHGYKGTNHTLKAIEDDPEMAGNLSAAAHLIHGTSEGRFKITYCPGDGVTRDEIESVGFDYRAYDDARAQYDPATLTTGWHEDADGTPFFYIANPALGLWASRQRLV
ncbi:MAG: lactate racemase domain-containing protein [Phycisphaeraceae bacterium]